MSEEVHYKGVLSKATKLRADETLEEQCKRLLDDKELPSYFESYLEMLLDKYYKQYVVKDSILYSVSMVEVNPYSDIFNATLFPNGDIGFEVKYYNGGCGFNEAIHYALDSLK